MWDWVSKKKGQEIDKNKIERTFIIQDESF